MKKKFLLCGVVLVVCIFAAFIYYVQSVPSGNTLESREELLDDAVSKGEGWTIVKEIKIDDCIVSAAYSTDYKATIAIFRSTSNGNYKFSTSLNRSNNDIIIGGAMINGQWYDLIWYNGAQTKYAEITYSISGKEDKILKYDTSDGGIIYIRNNEKEYNLSVCYYDSEGNKYE